ncbi:MAG: hypothetical protein C0425_09940 [Chlorobiaceae bacterium]|nr:hypothetical protein [Chlorobiaceae bacterium]MBA4310639.1 hypothetical protein [Chlorobiaceae bacterium]
MKKIKNRISIKTLIILFFPIINAIFSIAYKYLNHSLSLNNINLFYAGNILTLVIHVILAIGLLVLFFARRNEFNKAINFLFISAIFSFSSFLLAIVVTKIDVTLLEFYFVGQAFNKILYGFLFNLNLLIVVFIVNYSWFQVFNIKSLLLLRSLINTLVMGIILLILTFIYTKGMNETDINNFSNSDERVAVVLGAAVWSNNTPSTTLMERLNKTLELYQNKKIGKIQLTGSNAPGELSEAEVSFKYLSVFGINKNDIYVEKNTTSTIEQVKFIKEELIEKKGMNNILVVSDKYHLKRIRQIGKFYDINLELIGSELKLNSRDILYYRLRESIALLNFWFYSI